MSKPHSTLRPGKNIVLIVVWGVAATFLFLKCYPRPFVLLAAGAFLGFLGGMMQTLGFQEAKETFLDTSSMLDVRRRLNATQWGRRYLYFLWGASFVLIILSLAFTTNPVFSVLVGYFTLMFVREVVTLKPTFELDKLRRAVHEDPA